MTSRTDRLIARRHVAAAGRRATRGRPRVLAMHGVADPAAFDRQVTELLEWFRPVTADQVAAWYHHGSGLPDRAVWFTFDDGARSTIVEGATVLARHGVSATAFICPAFIEGALRPWWDVVADAVTAGEVVEVAGEPHHDLTAVTALKHVPDQHRREVVGSLAARFHEPGDDVVTVEDLRRWRDLGGDLGNHTWDHPCLDRCTVEEQSHQIDRAAAWLDEQQLWDRRRFAYPNGDRTDVAEAHLRSNRYELVALFDHALADRRRGPMRLSRLRIDAAAGTVRTAAVTSAWHSGLFALRRRANDVARAVPTGARRPTR